MKKTDGYNADIAENQKAKLKELFPEVFSEDKIDFNKLRATLGNSVELGEKYGLSWKGKSSVFAKIQEKTVSTLHPQPEASVDWDTTQNMFIEGDNLEALKVLHKAYYGKIKMIYIDPPYNTGNDFVYNDDFKKTRREQALEEGAIDDEGNITRDDGLRINTGGHKHSNWLDMMYPRLFLARNLLRQDGVIFVSIDDNEVHNLRLMMNDIFGEENFISEIAWRRRSNQPNDKTKMIGKVSEYILVFARNNTDLEYGKSFFGLPLTASRSSEFKNPDNDPRGAWTTNPWKVATGRGGSPYAITSPTGKVFDEVWYGSQSTFDDYLTEGRVYWTDGGNGYPRVKIYLSEKEHGALANNFWGFQDFGSNQDASTELAQLFGKKDIFDGPKPVRLMKQMLSLTTSKDNNDIVLDFFGGSGTLAHAVGELNAEDSGNRKWMMVQLPELTDEKSEAYKAGYKNIADIAKERIRRANLQLAEKAKETRGYLNGLREAAGYGDKEIGETLADMEGSKYEFDGGFRVFKIGDSNFKKWNELVAEPDEIKQQTLDSLNSLEDGVTDDDLLTEILLKRGVSPLAEVETHDSFIFVPSENLAVSLSRHMTEELFTQILTKSPSQIILLDQAFNNDASLKTNLILQAEKQNVIVEVL